MIHPVTSQNIALFETACEIEHLFGSKCLTALKAYGLDGPASFYVGMDRSGTASAALFLLGNVLTISTDNRLEPAEFAELIRQNPMTTEIDTNWRHCAALQRLIGGTAESSFFMAYSGSPISADFTGITGEYNLQEVFSVLQQSHEYYRTHLTYSAWASDLTLKLGKGLMELYQLNQGGKPVGTGSIVSEDETSGAIAAVAVIPEYRGRGLGTKISQFLVNRILEKGKQPVLISGYDAVAELYRKVGFQETGRWGELYL